MKSGKNCENILQFRFLNSINKMQLFHQNYTQNIKLTIKIIMTSLRRLLMT